MLRSLIISVVFGVLAFYAENVFAAKCWKTGSVRFGCTGVSKFTVLDNAPGSVKSIWFEKSEFTHVPVNVFYRFRNQLTSIDMHLSGINTIDSEAFNGLTKLENLTLWGNNLEAVWSVWFTSLNQLKYLDLSFNRISYIDERAFPLIPNLEYLYIDSNILNTLNRFVFSYMRNLKKVKLGKNPWHWMDRALIASELDNLHIDYSSEWDDYSWMNHVVWECIQKHQAKVEDDSVLDCASTYLLEQGSKIVPSVPSNNYCDAETKALYACAMRSDPSLNLTITPKIAVRKILQGFIGASQSMGNGGALFTGRTFH